MSRFIRDKVNHTDIPVAGLTDSIAIKNDIDGIKDNLSNPNLLDNPWFTVNQRGQSSYGGSVDYTFDRWKLNSVNGLISKSDDIITVDNSQGAGYFQLLNFIDDNILNSLRGKSITVSVMKTDGTIISASGIVPTVDPQSLLIVAEVKIGDVQFQLAHATNFNNYHFKITTSAGKAAQSFKAVKLELGSVSTLDMDTTPNYAIELAKCQLSTADSNDTYANRNSVCTELVLEQTVTTSTSTDVTATFTNSAILATSEVTPYFTEWGIVPSSVVTTAGQCEVTIPKQETASSLGVRIRVR